MDLYELPFTSLRVLLKNRVSKIRVFLKFPGLFVAGFAEYTDNWFQEKIIAEPCRN